MVILIVRHWDVVNDAHVVQDGGGYNDLTRSCRTVLYGTRTATVIYTAELQNNSYSL